MDNDEDDDDQQEQPAEEKVEEKKEEKKVIPPTKKGFKNKQGDYVVTSIVIPDLRDGLKKEKEAKKVLEDDSDSDEGYGDEDEPAQEAPKTDPEADKAKKGKFIVQIKQFIKINHFGVSYIIIYLYYFVYRITKKTVEERAKS